MFSSMDEFGPFVDRLDQILYGLETSPFINRLVYV